MLEFALALMNQVIVAESEDLQKRYLPVRHTCEYRGLVIDYKAWVNARVPEAVCIFCENAASYVCVITVFSIAERRGDGGTTLPITNFRGSKGRRLLAYALDILQHHRPVCLYSNCVRPPLARYARNPA